MMSSPAFEGIIRAAMLQGMMTSGEMTEAEAEKAIDQMMPMMALVFKGYQMEVTEVIGLEDKYTHQTTIMMVMPMDMSKFPGMANEPLDIQVNIQVTMNQFNDAPEITAPEDATIIPLDEILEDMPQMQ